MTLQVRNFSEKDIEEITRLMQTLCQSTHLEFNSARWQKSLHKKFSESDKTRMLVAEFDGVIAGMVFSVIRKTEYGFRYGYLSNLVVNPDYRGNRIGETLICNAIDFLRENHVESIRVAVRKESPEAFSLLQKIGFEKIIDVMEYKI